MERTIDYNEMISNNMGLVSVCMRRYMEILTKYNSLQEDMKQIGMIALYKAIENYDPSKNTKFSTFATTIIERDLNNFVNRNLKDYFDDLHCTSMETLVDSEDNDSECTLEEMIGIEDDISYLFNCELMERIKNRHGERAVKILYMRYEKYTMQEIADELGITKQRVEQIIKKIKKDII